MRLLSVLTVSLFCVALAACGGGAGVDDGGSTDGEGGRNDTENTNGTDDIGSHNPGEYCMECHREGGTGKGVFTVAGTVFRSNGSGQDNATVSLYIHNTNTLSIRLETDSSGNFYSTEPVDGLFVEGGGFVTGVDVVVEGPSGLRNMPGLITDGGCGKCHGKTNGNIVVN